MTRKIKTLDGIEAVASVAHKINEVIAGLDGFMNLHPFLPQLHQGGMFTQGAFQVMYELEQMLCEISGMDAFTLHPMAGAHGELTGMRVIRNHLSAQGNPRKVVLIPDSAHGTNPASAVFCGYETQEIIDPNGLCQPDRPEDVDACWGIGIIGPKQLT